MYNNVKNIKNKVINFNSCNLSINFGYGGIDSQEFVNVLFKMYTKWIKSKGIEYEIISNSKGFIKGKRFIEINIKNKYIYNYLKMESGMHKFIRKSPFDSGKRHTSFVYVYVKPYINYNNITINDKDIKFSFCKSSGSGGQHINKTNSAVRLFHIPTKLNIKSNNSRYQSINKKNVLKKLKNKIYNIEYNKRMYKEKKNKNFKLSINNNKQVRSYILDNSIIIDNITGMEIKNIKEILNGNLDIFFNKYNIKNINND